MTAKSLSDAPLVTIVDDDEGICAALADLFRSVGIETRIYNTTRDLLDADIPDRPGCLILDVRLPGTSGLELQSQLKAKGIALPIIFLTGHGDIPMSVRAMKAGAVDFLTKPVRDQDMLDVAAVAIERDRERRVAGVEIEYVRQLAETLTPREREVACAVTRGLMNKQIAFQLGITEITVKLHRGNVMRKFEARSVADLIHKAQLLGVEPMSTPS